ncbi:hypothetical protein EPA93_45380 [Ktedonosporobacter rubrisoli]|uniref:Protein kinase domain-containing protein n=1 Tax=Ktedonosporobacter rubrisoli TaxID=2509675 RepID=A0A4P6K435_KTERU|nr:AAA domain-containing protein [Ktedonosporobacter rubrisoli]QBD82815.1 hypothetical protein EPA93_45380 [Ktedonosporobacter rubrisoli]
MPETSNESSTRYGIGSYIKGEYIGEGGFGRVYKARHKHLDREDCIKELQYDRLSEDQENSVLREGHILNKLEHKNIVRLRDLVVQDNKIYMIMAYVDGGNLTEFLKNTPDSLSLDKIDTIIQQIADGLYYLHNEHHIIHRDLKPHNILRYSDDTIVIADFGLAKVIDTADIQSSYSRLGNAGTPAYMAPEHIMGQATYSSDLYSLGVIAYQLLTRQTPFGGGVKAKEGHLHKAPPALRDFNPKLSPEIEQVVLKMLAKKPEDRYPNSIEFARALHSAIIKATHDNPGVNPTNIKQLLPFFPDGQTINLEAGEYEGPFTIQKRLHLIGAGSLPGGPLTKLFAIDQPVFDLESSGVILENMLIQRTPENTDAPAIQINKGDTYELRHVTVQGKLTEEAIWQELEWQLPIDGIDFGRIPIGSKQERTVAIVVKEACEVKTDLPGLAVFPTHLSAGPRTLAVVYDAQGKLPGALLKGTIAFTLRSATEPMTIVVTGHIEEEQTILEPEEDAPLPHYELSYLLQDKAAQSLLRELGSDEDRDLVKEWEENKKLYRLRDRIRDRAFDLLFELIGQTAQPWYVKRDRISTENEEEEFWILIRATDSQIISDRVTARKQTIRLVLCIHREGRGKPRLIAISFPKVEAGMRKRDLEALPVLLRLAASVKSGIPQEFMWQIQNLPIESEHELDGDQVEGWAALLQLQNELYQKQQYWLRYTGHDYRSGALRVTFFLDRDYLLDNVMVPFPYEELRERTRETRKGKELHLLFSDLPKMEAEQKERRNKRGLKIGTLERIDFGRAEMIISLEQGLSKSLADGNTKLANSGYLHYDAYGDLQQIENQQQAISKLQQGKSLNPALPDFFFQAYKARTAPAIQRLLAADLLSGTCNPGQIAAIEAALATPDLLLLQGPPGTGKTTVIAEICYQVAQRNGRTLIASQSNLAVDNALSRLIHKPSIRALRKGNTGSVEVEGRDFTEERVVQKWLTDTARDCQSKLEQRQKHIKILENLVRDIEPFSLYYEAEKKWSNQQFSLQRKLEKINQEITATRKHQVQREAEEKKYISLHMCLSALVTGGTQLPEAALKDAYQYITETGDKNEFTACLRECFQVMKRVGLTFPEGSHLLQSIRWLQKTVAASMIVWTESQQHLNLINTTITDLSTVNDRIKWLTSSIQDREAQLPPLASRIELHKNLLQNITADKDALPFVEHLYQNLAERIEPIFRQFIDARVEQRPIDASIHPALELFFPEDVITRINRDSKKTFLEKWNSTGDVIQQYIYQTRETRNRYEQASQSLAYCRQRFGQLLAKYPEIRQGGAYQGSGNFPSNIAVGTEFPQLVEQLQSNLQEIERIGLNPPSLFDRFFDWHKQRLLQLFQNTNHSLMVAARQEQNILSQRRQSIAQVARDKALLLSQSFQDWMKEQLRNAESQYTATLQKHDQLVVEHKQMQDLLANEIAQLPAMHNTMRDLMEKLATQFQDLHKRAELPEALRQIAQSYARPHASFLKFRQEHYAAYQRWVEDTRAMETGVARLWQMITAAAERVEKQLASIQAALEPHKQAMSQLSVKRDQLTMRLQQGQADLDTQRAWWERRWNEFPADLRPAEPETGIYTPSFLKTMQQQIRSWRMELDKEQTFARRFDRLITDWVTRLNNLSENDRQDLRDIYLKNANVIGITCGQVNRLDRQENRSISRFDVVIIDEVSKATPPEILLAALKGKKLILIGDQRQLPPMIEEKTLEQLAKENGQERSAFRYLSRPYFEQRYNEAPDGIKRMLHIQYRMHPDIMAAINQFYHRPLEYGLNEPDSERDHQLHSALIRRNKHLIWISTPLVSTSSQSRSSRTITARNRMSGQVAFPSYQSDSNSFGEEAEGTSYKNQREMEIIIKICEELQRLWAPKRAAGIKKKEIGIITFYGAQLALLEKNLKSRKKDFSALEIRTGTVDRFQGMERPIVIVSMVRNNRGGDIGFAEKDERINVAFSRAQELLIIVGCHDLFCVRARQEDAAERYSKVASVVRNRGDFIDISNS